MSIISLKLAESELGNYAKEKVSILVVDDLPEKLLAYEAILEELGQNLVKVRSGEEALKAVLQQEFAVILLDVNMPGMDGFETASLIRQRKKSAHTPIIFLTAFTDEVRMAQGYASGAVDYLPTPVVPDVLKAKVRVFIELSQMRRQAALQAEEQAKRAAVEESAKRLRFLVRVGEVLALSHSWRELVREMVQLPVPEIADVTILRIVHPDTGQVLIKYSWQQDTKILVQSVSSDHPLCDFLENFQANYISDETELDFRLSVPLIMPDEPEWHRLQQGIALPVVTQGEANGLLLLARWEKPYVKEEISLMNDFAARASIGIENVLLLERIREADQRKDEFLAMLAHELRNPLAPMQNALQVMKISSERELRQRAQETIENQLNHMVHLVDDLMDVSRITKGKIELKKKTILLQEVLHHAVDSARPLIEKKNHQLHIHFDDEPIWIYADPTRIVQIFSNLLNNAAKYTPDGGEVSFRCEQENEIAKISVQDNGIGVPPDMLHRIFELFSQVDSSIERAEGGLGIGLTLVQSLTEMHDGSITVESGGNIRGSIFSVRFPTVLAPEEEILASSSAMAEKPSLKVLVVDDNEASAKTLGWMLELVGHEIRLAGNGQDAIRIADEYMPDVILLDIGLPGMNGYEVCKALRSNPKLCNSYFVAQTGWGQEEHRRQSKEAGFHSHLVKPIEMPVLQKLFEEASWLRKSI